MNREQEFEKVKSLIKRDYEEAECGIYFTRNIMNDPMNIIFKGGFFTLEICRYWGYFEVFGCSETEEEELESLYESLGENYGIQN